MKLQFFRKLEWDPAGGKNPVALLAVIILIRIFTW
jgi:hypothetical protein